MNCYACSEKYNGFRCPKCGLVEVTKSGDNFTYTGDYREEYILRERSDKGIRLNLVRLGIVAEFAEIGSQVVDFGAGVGTFAHYANTYYDILCYDLTRANMYPGVKSTILLKEAIDHSPDLVTFFDSLEHVPSPKDTLGRMIDSCRPGILITTPDPSSVKDKDLLSWVHYKPDEHLFLFTPESMDHIMSGFNYTRIHTGYEESSIRNTGGDKSIVTLVYTYD